MSKDVDKLVSAIKRSAERVTTRGVIDAERKVIEAAQELKHGFTAEDQTPDYWKQDFVLDHRIVALFHAIEALERAKEQREP